MTPDQLEIENSRYLPAAFFVLPLASGRIAILTPRRDLFRIVDTWEEAKAWGPCAVPRYNVIVEQEPIKINLAALGVKL